MGRDGEGEMIPRRLSFVKLEEGLASIASAI